MSNRDADDRLKEMWARTDMRPAPKRIRTPQRQLVMGCLAAVVLPVFLGLFLNDLVNGPDLTDPAEHGAFDIVGGGLVVSGFLTGGEGPESFDASEYDLRGWLRCRALGVENEDENGPARFAATIHASNRTMVLVDRVDTKAWGAKTAKFGPGDSDMQPPYRVDIDAVGKWEIECKHTGRWR